MDELLPCPLCQIGNVTVAHTRAGVEWWSVECGRDEDGCGLCINRSTRSAAIAAWNTRATPPAPVEQDVERVIALALLNEQRAFFGLKRFKSLDGLEDHVWRDQRRQARAVLSAISTLTPARAEGWMPINSAPAACHVLATYLDQEAGEWIVSVEFSPPQLPFTHWQMLPTPPALGSNDHG